MASESEFPKKDGDIFYASEVNRFSPKLIGNIIQDVATNISGTNYTVMGGSITYPGTGSLQISEFMNIQHGCFILAGVAANYTSRLRASGVGVDMVMNTKIGSTTAELDNYLSFNHILTSGAMTASGGNIGSPYVISLEGKSNRNIASVYVRDFTILGY